MQVRWVNDNGFNRVFIANSYNITLALLASHQTGLAHEASERRSAMHARVERNVNAIAGLELLQTHGNARRAALALVFLCLVTRFRPWTAMFVMHHQ